MRRRAERAKKLFPNVVIRALYIEAEIEVKEVTRRTPVDTGELRASVFQKGPVREWRTIYTLIVAGGPAAPYAIHVHENLEAFHKVGQAKFIESVILESRAFMGQRLARRIEINRALA